MPPLVALLAEGVDRNQLEDLLNGMNTEVALLAEGVDRNFVDAQIFSPFDVALLAEGVDRNISAFGDSKDAMRSPSSRRAWIEIT